MNGKTAKLLRWWSAIQPRAADAKYSVCKKIWKRMNHIELGKWSGAMKADVAAYKARLVGSA